MARKPAAPKAPARPKMPAMPGKMPMHKMPGGEMMMGPSMDMMKGAKAGKMPMAKGTPKRK